MKNTTALSAHAKTKIGRSRAHGLVIAFFGFWAVFYAQAFLYWTVVPFFQMKTYLAALSKGAIRKIVQTDFIFSPYSYAQRVIRYEFLKYMESQEMSPLDIPLLDKAIEKMEAMVAMEGSDPYQHIRLARAFEKKVALLKDPSYFKQAEIYYKNAITMAPQRQEVYYAYGLSLVRQNRLDEAVHLLKSPPALDPDIPLSYYYLGLAQFNQGQVAYRDTLQNMEFFFERVKGNPDANLSRAIYQRLFHSFYHEQDTARLAIASRRLLGLDPDRKNLYQQVIAEMKQANQVPRLEFKDYLLQALL